MSEARLSFTPSIVLQVLCLVLLQQVCLIESAKDKGCGDIRSNVKLERDIAKLFVLSENGRRYPENRKELKVFCDETTVLLRSVENYKDKCFTGSMKQYASLFVYSNKNTVKRFCSRSANKKRVDDMLALAPCTNHPQTRSGLVKCMRDMVETLVGVKYAPDNLKMGHLCCTIRDLRGCMEQTILRSVCKDQIDLFSAFLEVVSGNVNSDAFCGDYGDESDKCSKLPAPPKKKDNEKVPETILFPFYDIVNSVALDN